MHNFTLTIFDIQVKLDQLTMATGRLHESIRPSLHQNHRRIVDPNQSIRDRYKLTHPDSKPRTKKAATWDLKSWLARELQDTREAVDMSIFMKIRPVHTLHTLAFLFCRYDRLCVLGVFAPELAWKRWFGHPQFVAGWKEGGYRAGPVWQST
jgi:hypothetical protein